MQSSHNELSVIKMPLVCMLQTCLYMKRCLGIIDWGHKYCSNQEVKACVTCIFIFSNYMYNSGDYEPKFSMIDYIITQVLHFDWFSPMIYQRTDAQLMLSLESFSL